MTSASGQVLQQRDEAGGPSDGRPVDRWRCGGQPVEQFADFRAEHCTGDRGLCGVCAGHRCHFEPETTKEETQA